MSVKPKWSPVDQPWPLTDPLDPRVPSPVPDWIGPLPDSPEPHAPQADARSTIYVDDFRYWRDVQSLFWFPLAQLYVPKSHLGTVYGIQTHLIGTGPEFKNYNLNNDPLAFGRDNLPLYNIVWRLTLEDKQKPEVNFTTVHPWPTLTGILCPDLGQWSDQRFAFSAHYGRTKIMVPEDTYIRLWGGISQIGSVPYTVGEIGGRLIGLVQAYGDNPAATETTREGW